MYKNLRWYKKGQNTEYFKYNFLLQKNMGRPSAQHRYRNEGWYFYISQPICPITSWVWKWKISVGCQDIVIVHANSQSSRQQFMHTSNILLDSLVLHYLHYCAFLTFNDWNSQTLSSNFISRVFWELIIFAHSNNVGVVLRIKSYKPRYTRPAF